MNVGLSLTPALSHPMGEGRGGAGVREQIGGSVQMRRIDRIDRQQSL